MVTPSPLLIISDAVSSPTGLGRIAGEIAARADINLKDVCRIATMGYGGPGSRRFNFSQYAIEGMGSDFVIPNLPEVWADWAGDEAGVILCIWDASRLGWFSRPNMMCEEPVLKQFLTTAKVQRWTYSPLDAEGPHGKLSYPQTQALLGFDRILAYGQFGEGLIRDSLGSKQAQSRDLDSIPHGIDSRVFYPRDRSDARKKFYALTKAISIRNMQMETSTLNAEPLVGAVATNQRRKDWGLWAESCALFLSRRPDARFWIHTDILERDWSIPELLVDWGLIDRTAVSFGHLTDEEMAQAYSACDLTLGIGAGEGFGFPIAESLFCGTPCIHGKYAGAVDFMTEGLLINPVAFRYDGPYSCHRPVFAPGDWVDKMEHFVRERVNPPDQLDWSSVWPRFESWFRKGFPK